MEQQTYINMTIEISEPLYPMPNVNVIKSDVGAVTDKYPTN